MTINWSVAGVVVVVLAIIGATTYLGAAGVVSGATVVQLFMAILGAAGVFGGVHVTTYAIRRTVMPTSVVNNSIPEVGTKNDTHSAS